MALTLAQYRTRVNALLVDAAATIFTTAIVDEALRSALREYQQACPLTTETVIVLPGVGREIALSGVSGLLGVSGVWWPYDSTVEDWPPSRVRGFRVWWDDAQPVLFLDADVGSQPQVDDELRLWYTKLHTIQDLDAGDATTVRADDESLLATGAAGFAASMRAVDVTEQYGGRVSDPQHLVVWGAARLGEFRAGLALRRGRPTGPGPAISAGWRVDEWDERA